MKLDQLTPLFEGITHIEDLAIDEFIDALRNFDKFEISEKIDGSNLQFGYDDEGFYTSRETKKGTQRMRNVNDYPIEFRTTFQRSAHAALEKITPLLLRSEFFSQGDAVEVEVLFGKLPNTVPYSMDTNRIIFLRPTAGDPDIEGIADLVDGQTISVTLETPFTLDGETIQQKQEKHQWVFAQTPTVDGSEVVKSEAFKDIEKQLDKVEKFLKKPSGVGKFSNAEVISLPLNKRPEGVSVEQWKKGKEIIKNMRKKFFDVAEDGTKTGFKHDVKEFLLKELVRKIGSAFGPDVKDGGWIEGVVFRHKDTGRMFKIVDKDMFTTINKFLWKVRGELSDKPKGVDNITSLLGKILSGMATALGHPHLATLQAKRYLRKFGDSKEEILAGLSEGVKFENVQSYWLKYLDMMQEEFNKQLDKYNKERESMALNVNNREIKYDDDVHKRTLQTFADIKQMLNEFERDVAEASTAEDLILVLVGKQIEEL